MKKFILVFLGGGLGCTARYAISRLLNNCGVTNFPIATFTVNIIGCFLIGFLGTYIARHCLPNNLYLLLVTGMCGGFTTFSTFSNESLTLLKNGQYVMFTIYVSASITVGLISVLIGKAAVTTSV